MSYYRYSEPKIGRMNHLKITQKTSAGAVLDGDILLPTKSIPRSIPANIGDTLEVFVYANAQGKLTATTQKPFTEVGKFADLQVVEISDYGIFLDWGLPKDLMLPFNEEVGTLAVEDFAIVYTYMDERSQRITATMKYDKYLDQTPHSYKEGDEVMLLIESRTPLGLNVIVNHAHRGLVFKSDINYDAQIGSEVTGYIKNVREDGKLDILLQPVIKTAEDRNSLESKILEALKINNGSLPMSDKSAPEEIQRRFGVSKSAFKRAIGGLFKAQKIRILKDKIELND